MTTTVDPCVHYYMVEEAHGPKSRGVCRKCGDEKFFFNSIDYQIYEIERRVKKNKEGHLK